MPFQSYVVGSHHIHDLLGRERDRFIIGHSDIGVNKISTIESEIKIVPGEFTLSSRVGFEKGARVHLPYENIASRLPRDLYPQNPKRGNWHIEGPVVSCDIYMTIQQQQRKSIRVDTRCPKCTVETFHEELLDYSAILNAVMRAFLEKEQKEYFHILGIESADTEGYFEIINWGFMDFHRRLN